MRFFSLWTILCMEDIGIARQNKNDKKGRQLLIFLSFYDKIQNWFYNIAQKIEVNMIKNLIEIKE